MFRGHVVSFCMLFALGACVDHAPSWADFVANDMTAGTGASSDGGVTETTGPASTIDEPSPATGEPEDTTDATSTGEVGSTASDAELVRRGSSRSTCRRKSTSPALCR
ncbi:hypothetical protein [Nannocystis sp. SCPEA4]|uniref:hypothetical protein n=1 Tax=Nannocystis sp. SCPEA4 TaxID=2996787 RepID=UPI002270C8B6|nr:hypothetical protein [Nannocystis sp. SCPEA4]MCY1054633.1 hypothetical protein [Nannocystis sp. SCPEA4]